MFPGEVAVLFSRNLAVETIWVTKEMSRCYEAVVTVSRYTTTLWVNFQWKDDEVLIDIVLDQHAELDVVVVAHWNNIPRVDMSLHLDTLFWFRANQSS
jgi:hypothetical protein